MRWRRCRPREVRALQVPITPHRLDELEGPSLGVVRYLNPDKRGNDGRITNCLKGNPENRDKYQCLDPSLWGATGVGGQRKTLRPLFSADRPPSRRPLRRSAHLPTLSTPLSPQSESGSLVGVRQQGTCGADGVYRHLLHNGKGGHPIKDTAGRLRDALGGPSLAPMSLWHRPTTGRGPTTLAILHDGTEHRPTLPSTRTNPRRQGEKPRIDTTLQIKELHQ